ncbi:MAG: uridine diphosphate-N-acetylglucosamine-binding protein YvcK [Planctomycetaceae bacterium]|nr:uridine diphosphate-N-acetylglucosamine-binding protein YvcK [Planctomycetaceae bacterium]
MANWNWLRPGMRIKRWVFLITFGLMIVFMGAMFLTLGVFMPDAQPFGMDTYGTAVVLLIPGTVAVFIGIYRLVRRIEKMLRRADDRRDLGEIVYQYNRLEHGPRFCCFGGGTGLSTLLSGVRDYSQRITAIVSVADDGGSSGRLRLDFDMLPPGDIRNCLVALSDTSPSMAQLLQYRFPEGEFAGHSFGNLFITVLAIVQNDFGSAVREMNKILAVRGQVLPATLDKISLVANHPDGSKTTGQQWIAKCGKDIESLELKPEPGDVSMDVLAAIRDADLITLGPGSLFTSVLPNLLDPKIVTAVNASDAKVLFIVNTAGQVGETKDFAVSTHLKMLKKHAPELKIDLVLINNRPPTEEQRVQMAEKGITPTEYDVDETLSMGVKTVLWDVVNTQNPIRHDPKKTAAAIMAILEDIQHGRL